MARHDHNRGWDMAGNEGSQHVETVDAMREAGRKGFQPILSPRMNLDAKPLGEEEATQCLSHLRLVIQQRYDG